MNRYAQDFSHEKPLRRIVCQNCGSPAEFDIVAQSYRCAYCHQISGLEKKGKKPSTWRQFASKNNRQRDFQLQRHACPACGAKVIFQYNESSETCDFCASKLVRTHLDVPDQFPDLIIPFLLLLMKLVNAFWIGQNGIKERKKVGILFKKLIKCRRIICRIVW